MSRQYESPKWVDRQNGAPNMSRQMRVTKCGSPNMSRNNIPKYWVKTLRILSGTKFSGGFADEFFTPGIGILVPYIETYSFFMM